MEKNSRRLWQKTKHKKQSKLSLLSLAVVFSTALGASQHLAAAEDNKTVADKNAEKTSANKGDAALLQAVTVHGQKLQNKPESVSLITGEELQKFHVNNFRDIVNRIGNVRTSWQNPNTTSIFVRGVGWAAGAGVLDPSVGVTVDGVSYGISAIAALANFDDIETVEVNRGPSGVYGGKNFSVGVVNIKTRSPSFTPEASASLTFGELNTVSSTATLGGAVIDDLLAFRLSLHRETADGPYDNKNDSHFTWRNTDRTNARAQFLLLPADNVKAELAIDYTPTGREICENCFTFRDKTPAYYDSRYPNGNQIPVVYAEDGFGKIQRRWFQQKSDYNVADYYAHSIDTANEYPNTYATRGASLNISAELDAGVLSSITGYRDYKFSQGAGTHTPFEWLRAPRGTQTEYNQFSQEIKWAASLSDSLRYETGVYYFSGEFPNTGQTERYGSDGGAWYANNTQYTALDTNAEGRLLLLNSLDGLITQSKNKLDNTSEAIYANFTWEATQKLSLNAGLRFTNEERHTNSRSFIQSEGFAWELDPAVVNNVILIAADQVQAANNLIAQKYFNLASYDLLNSAQLAQVAAAKGIRAGRIGALYQPVDAEAYEETLPATNLGASYQLNNLDRIFVSWKHGEKAGVSQIVGATQFGGKSFPAETEKSDAFEIGTKSIFLDKDLSVNATVFLQNIKNYLQPIYVYDEVQTKLNNNSSNAYTSAIGNVPKVQTRGVELDLAYAGFEYTTLRFSGAYTEAVYKDFKFLAKPSELGGTSVPYYDASGKTLPGAPKFSGNLFADYSYPISGGKLVHANFNYNYITELNNDPSLSRFATSGPYGITDISVGIGRQDRKFDISLVVKNVFDEDTGFKTTWNSYKPGIPRWVGVTINAAL
ncbi:MAG TPA: TonB-dependent receptor [Cellvibrio sp.]|nr:TonB-dependent receptor [Cellvibrio sp.]